MRRSVIAGGGKSKGRVIKTTRATHVRKESMETLKRNVRGPKEKEEGCEL